MIDFSFLFLGVNAICAANIIYKHHMLDNCHLSFKELVKVAESCNDYVLVNRLLDLHMNFLDRLPNPFFEMFDLVSLSSEKYCPELTEAKKIMKQELQKNHHSE